MQKFIQITVGDTIDRYHLKDISINDFIDCFLQVKVEKVEDITPEEYFKHRRFPLEFNVDDKFESEHYVFKHPSEEARIDWEDFITELNSSHVI